MNEKYKPIILAFISGGVLAAIFTFISTTYTKSNDAVIRMELAKAKEELMQEIYKAREEEHRKIVSFVEAVTSAKGRALNAVEAAEKAVASIVNLSSQIGSIANKAKETSSSIEALEVELSKAGKIDLNELGKIIEPAILKNLSLKGSVIAFDSKTCPSGWEIFVPAQGRFLRGIDHKGGADEKERSPGNIQEDSFQGHRHKIDNVVSSAHGPNDKAPHGFQNGGYKMLISETQEPTTDSTYGNARADKETRPKNVAVLFCKKQ